MFRHVAFNIGYTDIDDLLKEANNNYGNIFALCRQADEDIWDNELLSNIEIIVNCFYSFENNEYGYGYYYKKEKALKNIELLFNAIRAWI